MNSSASSLPDQAEQALNTLSDTSVQALMGNGLPEWAALSMKLGFPTPLPEKPVAPSAPEKPQVITPPREDDPKYSVELSMLDKLVSSRRIKKQDASLKRFEKDRKAWNENRDYALGLYELAQKKHQKEVATLEAGYETALSQWKEDFEGFLRQLVQQRTA